MSQKTALVSLAGAGISLVLPLVYVLILYPLIIKANFNEPLESITGLVFMWVVTAVLILYILFVEKDKLDSIGFRKISLRQFFKALGLGLLLSFLVPAFYFLLSLLVEKAEVSAVMEATDSSPILILFGIITASITEELLIRAYPLERMERAFSNKWAGSIISISIFVLLHLQNWDIRHIIGVVLPLGAALTFIYLRTRNLIFVIIIHFVIDLPLFIISLTKEG